MKALIDIDTMETIWVEDDQGRRWRLEGRLRGEDGWWRCPVEECGAACCRKPDGSYCGDLDINSLKCNLHARVGSPFQKPLCCALWPWNPHNFLNEVPECRLRMVPCGDAG